MRLLRLMLWTIALILAAAAYAQPPAVQWTHSFPNWDRADPNEIIQCYDGGYLVGGGRTIYQPFLLKVDSLGNAQWFRQTFAVGPLQGSKVKDIIQNPDSSYVILGVNFLNPWGPRYWYASKITASGDTVWRHIITHGTANGDPWSIARCADGGYVVGGENYAGLLRLSPTGQNLYERVYAGQICGLFPLEDGTYTGGGTAFGNAEDFYLVHTDTLGVMTWQQTYSRPGRQVCYAVDRTGDSGFVLAGYDSVANGGNSTDVYVLRVDAAGTPLWERRYNMAVDEYALDVHPAADGGFLVLAYIGGTERILKLSAAGDSLWSVPVNAYALSVTRDGGFVVAGGSSWHLVLTKFAPELVAPPAPAHLTASIADNQIVLQWDPVAGAVSYRVYSAPSADGPYMLDESGTFADGSWTSPVAGHNRSFYYVTAVR